MPALRLATFLAPNAYPAYAALTDYLARRLQRSTVLQVADTHDAYLTLNPDLAFICGLPYVLLRRQGVPIEALCAPVLVGERYAGRPIYFSDVIVRADAPYARFEDLRACRWAYNEEVSQSGYGITRHTLLQMGETRGFFGQVINLGWHQRAIQAVIDGTIDATAIDSQVLAIELSQRPELTHQLKIIAVLGPSTIQPVVVRADLPNALKQSLQEAICQAHTDDAVQNAFAQAYFAHFVPITDSSYHDIRAMLSSAEQAQFLRIDPTMPPTTP